MENEKTELLDIYKKLDAGNRAEVLSRARLVLTIQENTEKRYQKALKALAAGDLPYTLPSSGPVMGEAV